MILARQKEPKEYAKWVRRALLFDAAFDCFKSLYPLAYLASRFLTLYADDELCARDIFRATEDITGSCETWKRFSLVSEGAECAFGGNSVWLSVLKFKNRVLPLISGPRKVMKAFMLRHWFAGEQGRMIAVREAGDEVTRACTHGW